MRLGLPDELVKRIATVAFHSGKGSVMSKVSNVYNTLKSPDTISQVASAHMMNAMQHKFSNKDDENSFKEHFAKAAAINRGKLEPIPPPKG